MGDEPNPPPPAQASRGATRVPPRERRLGPPPPPPEQERPIEHPPETVTVDLGSEFHLTLPTAAVPGHLWRVEVAGGGVCVLGETFDAGVPVTYRVRLGARAPGDVTVRCLYAKPWGTIPREIRTFSIKVRPEGAPG